MSKHGAVAGCSKDYIEVHGCRIENERRNVLFTAIVNKQAVINSELDMFGLFYVCVFSCKIVINTV